MSDSLFTIKKFHIEFDEMNEPIYLIPFGDVHRFAPMCDDKLWLETLEWAKTKPRCYFLGMGDYDDLASESERYKIKSAQFHESTEETLEDLYLSRTNKFIKEIEFMKGRLLGMIEGNHHADLSWGQTTTQHMCKELKCAYLGVASMIRLTFKHTKSGKSGCIDICAHHGTAGMTQGSSLQAIDKMSCMVHSDLNFMGHNHKKGIATKTVLSLSEGNGSIRLTGRKVLLARTGSFLKGYEPDKKSYVVKKMMSPTDLGVIKVELTPKREQRTVNGARQENFFIDIHASI